MEQTYIIQLGLQREAQAWEAGRGYPDSSCLLGGQTTVPEPAKGACDPDAASTSPPAAPRGRRRQLRAGRRAGGGAPARGKQRHLRFPRSFPAASSEIQPSRAGPATAGPRPQSTRPRDQVAGPEKEHLGSRFPDGRPSARAKQGVGELPTSPDADRQEARRAQRTWHQTNGFRGEMRAGDPSACSVLLPGLGDYSLLGALLHPPHIQVPTCFQLGLLGQPRPERRSLCSEKLAFLFLCSQMARPLTTPSPSQMQARKKRRGVSEQQPLRSPGGFALNPS